MHTPTRLLVAMAAAGSPAVSALNRVGADSCELCGQRFRIGMSPTMPQVYANPFPVLEGTMYQTPVEGR
jgi:hypothetical protein